MCLEHDRCMFLKDSVGYLHVGHHIDAQGCHTTTRKVEATLKALAPASVSELRSFLGLLNYYRKFIPNLVSCSCSSSQCHIYSEVEVSDDGVSSVQMLSRKPRRSSWRCQCLLTMTCSSLSNWPKMLHHKNWSIGLPCSA